MSSYSVYKEMYRSLVILGLLQGGKGEHGEHGWCSGENNGICTNEKRVGILVLTSYVGRVVGSLPCPERFSLGSLVIPS